MIYLGVELAWGLVHPWVDLQGIVRPQVWQPLVELALNLLLEVPEMRHHQLEVEEGAVAEGVQHPLHLLGGVEIWEDLVLEGKEAGLVDPLWHWIQGVCLGEVQEAVAEED